jgi:ribonucleoside-diphosphate reductase alpha chain
MTAHLPTTYQQYIAASRYARFLPKEKRREAWPETVKRTMDFWRRRYPNLTDRLDEIEEYILRLAAMGSMRVLMTAGKALERDEIAGYNCSYDAITGSGETLDVWDDRLQNLGYSEPIKFMPRHPIVFDELLYVLLCGTGAGFSVERQFIKDLPTVGRPLARSLYAPDQFPRVDPEDLAWIEDNTIHIPDTKYGWASSLRIAIVESYNGNFDWTFDTSRIRAEGEPLNTFGGRASGPAPLETMLSYTRDLFREAFGRKLTSLECHDLVCVIGSVVVVGGVRRTALISLSNLSDTRMRGAKMGDWWETHPHRRFANDSTAYTERPSIGTFMEEWQALYDSKAGERGVFNREAAKLAAAAIDRDPDWEFGTNPCGEIILRPKQFCNLSEVIVRPDDDLQTLRQKVYVASALGTLQSSLTNFVYLSEQWRKNCEEERLLGVSISGACDHPVLSAMSLATQGQTRAWLHNLRELAWSTNAEWAELIGINRSKAITCVKPSGTVSQLVDCASGLHPRYAPYYIRRVRSDAKDPLAQVMMEQGFPYEYEIGNPSTVVFSFPIKSPENAVFRDDRTAIQQLEYWLLWKEAWCDHNPSITVYVKEHEWMEVGAWVYKHFDKVCGISFLPHSDHIYKQAPYEECSEDVYYQLRSQLPEYLDLEALSRLEDRDNTTGTQEPACMGGACDVL